MVRKGYRYAKSLYQKTSFEVKSKGWLSFLIDNVMGVNQGGVASGLLFRKYMADLGDYLDYNFGVCLDDVIFVHLLWADDFILMSESVFGMQRLLNGLQRFCSHERTILNLLKTKCLLILYSA